MEEFWEYIYQNISKINFSDVDKKDIKKVKEGFLFSNETNVIMAKIMEKYSELKLRANIVFAPAFVILHNLHNVHCEENSVVILERYIIILNYPSKNNQIDYLYQAHSPDKMPSGWFVIKYRQPNKYALDDIPKEHITEIRETNTKIRVFLNQRPNLNDELKIRTKVKEYFGEEIVMNKDVEILIDVGARPQEMKIKKISKFCDICNFNMPLEFIPELNMNACPICTKTFRDMCS